MTAGLASGWVPDGFTTGRVLGRGGSGTVYEARQTSTGRAVALKILDVDGTSEEVRRRFDRERSAMAELAAHPHIVSILGAGVQDGRPWLAMDLCRLGSLARLTTPVPVDEALVTLAAVADALAAAHAHGVVHCDVKPGNVLVTDYARPQLSDFGIARLAVSGTRGSTIGGYTLDHVPPEVVDGDRPTDRGDVFSLGTTAWQLLASRPPFREPGDGSPAAVMRRIQKRPLPVFERDDVPADAVDLLARMTAKEPSRRPSAAEVAAQAATLAGARGTTPSAPLTSVAAALRALPAPGGPAPGAGPSSDGIPADRSRGAATGWPAHHPSRPGPPLGATGFGTPHTSGVGGRTGHRPDLAALTRGGRAAPVAAPPPPVATASEPKRRDPVVIVAVVAAVLVLLACGGFVTYRLMPASTTTAAPPPPVTTTTVDKQRSSTATGLPRTSATTASTAVLPTKALPADPAASQPAQVSGPAPAPVQPKILLSLACTQKTPTTCQGGTSTVAFRSQVTSMANAELGAGCFDYSTVTGPGGEVVYQDSFACNSRATVTPTLAGTLPDGDYTIRERAEVQGGGSTSTSMEFSVRS